MLFEDRGGNIDLKAGLHGHFLIKFSEWWLLNFHVITECMAWFH